MSDGEEDWANDGVLETWSATRRSVSRRKQHFSSSSQNNGDEQSFEEDYDDDETYDEEEEEYDEEAEQFSNSAVTPQKHHDDDDAAAENDGGNRPAAAAAAKVVTTTRAAKLRYAARHKAKRKIDSVEEIEQRAAEKLAQREKVGLDFLPTCALLGTLSMPIIRGGRRTFSRSASGVSAGSSVDGKHQHDEHQHQHLDPQKRAELERQERMAERQRDLHRATNGVLPVDSNGMDIGTRLFRTGGKNSTKPPHSRSTQQRQHEEQVAECTFRPQVSEVAELLFPSSRDPNAVVRALAKSDMDRRRNHMQHLRAANDAQFARQHTFTPATETVSQLLCQRSGTIHNLPAAAPCSKSSKSSSRVAVARAASERLFRDAADKEVRDALRRQFVEMWQLRGWDEPGAPGQSAGAALNADEIADLTERLSRRYKDKEQVLKIIREEQYRQLQQLQCGDDDQDDDNQGVPLASCRSTLEVSVAEQQYSTHMVSSRSSSRQQQQQQQQRGSAGPMRLIDALCPVAAAPAESTTDELQKLGKKLMTLQLSSQRRPN